MGAAAKVPESGDGQGGVVASSGSARAARLREAHCHLPWLGRTLALLDLSACESMGAALALLKEAAAERRAAGNEAWLCAHGARPQAWAEARWMTRAQLDEAVGNLPTLVMSFDHHGLMASSAGLAAAGFVEGAADPEGGVCARDERGRLTGLLLETAAWRAWNAVPEPTAAERGEQIAAAARHLYGLGYYECCDLFSPAWLGPLLAELDRAGELPLAVELFVPLDEAEAAVAGRKSWERERVRLRGAKIFTDGTLNSRTAWMLEPFADPLRELPCGKAMMTRGQIGAALARARGLGLQLAAHAIGDGAVRACLDAAQDQRAGAGGLRIEHCEFVHPADVPRFAELGVIASVQPCHLLTDIEAVRRSTPDREERVMPWRAMIDAGLEPGRTLLFGSDCPVVRADAEDSVLAATQRRRAGMPEHAAIGWGQRISEVEAWACLGLDGETSRFGETGVKRAGER